MLIQAHMQDDAFQQELSKEKQLSLAGRWGHVSLVPFLFT